MIAVRIVAAAMAAFLAACSVAQKPSVAVVADSFCVTAEKRTWSVNDTPESISEAVKWNAGIDKACGIKRATAS